MQAPLTNDFVLDFVKELLGERFHHKLVLSIAHAVIGAMHTDKLGVTALGTAMAHARGVSLKHAVKQVDRLLSNDMFDTEVVFEEWVYFVVAERKQITVILDWTEFAQDGHSTLMLSLVTEHGRSTPLMFKTYKSNRLKNKRNDYEDKLLENFAAALPPDVKVTLLADRAFGDTKLYEFLRSELGWDFVIRFRDVIHVHGNEGSVKAKELVRDGGEAVAFDDVAVTMHQVQVPRVVAVHEKDMKEPWLLVSSRKDLSATETVQMYGKRFTTEETFRDEKDRRFGLGLSEATIGDPRRRDRLLVVASIAMTLLTLLGAAGEQLGLAKQLRVNTERAKRTHSLLRQGREYMKGAFRKCHDALRAAFAGLLEGHFHVVKPYAIL